MKYPRQHQVQGKNDMPGNKAGGDKGKGDVQDAPEANEVTVKLLALHRVVHLL